MLSKFLRDVMKENLESKNFPLFSPDENNSNRWQDVLEVTKGCYMADIYPEDDKKVREWLRVASGVPGFIGFAVGRTVFWNPLVDFRAGKISRDEAVARIAASYREWVDVFENRGHSA